MKYRSFSLLLALAMCLSLLAGCAFFSRQTEENTPDDPSPGQNITDPAPKDNEASNELPAASDAPEVEEPPVSAEPDAAPQPDSAPEPEPSPEPDSTTEPETDPPTQETPDAPDAGSDTTAPEDTPDREQSAAETEPEPTTPEANPAALSEDELRAIEAWFNDRENNGLLRFPYDTLSDPTILAPYLEFLFYDIGEQSVSSEERALLSAAGMYTETDIFRLGRGFVMRYLLEKLEIDLRNVDMSALQSIPVPGWYLETYDAWYICHGDTMYGSYAFDRGERLTDDTVVIYYVNNFLAILTNENEFDYLSDVTMELTVRQTSDGWRVISHKFCR